MFVLFVLVWTQTINLNKTKDEHIVMFHKYLWINEHEKYLSKILGTLKGLHILERRNPSTNKYPSDFCIIEIENQEILSKLLTNKEIKHVYLNKRVYLQPKGKIFTKIIEPEFSLRKLLMNQEVTDKLQVQKIWEKGFTGKGVKVAIFDTGLRKNQYIQNIEEEINYTNEESSDDQVGHGTFVTGLIGSRHQECKGFSPDSTLFIFKVFTSRQNSYTSWFLDAFNYALLSGINILNLSIGGPDYEDAPFIEKVNELTSNNIIVISASGNDGPLYGTLNNPGDLQDVIGVGAIDDFDNIASFSSRGVTTKELREGYGRVKPDIVTYGNKIKGLSLNGGCVRMDGTSVACPVITGSISLLASTLPIENRWKILNPASMKQIIIESAIKLKGSSIFEQGSGKFDLLRAFDIIQTYKPKATVYPSSLDLTNCNYMWPFCSQEIYFSGMPLLLNLTILNGLNVHGKVKETPKFTSIKNGHMLNIKFKWSQDIWPFTGSLSIEIEVNENGKFFNGFVEGNIELTIVSDELKSDINIPLKVEVIKTPLRRKRILWDQYHNIQYPIGYIPRDNLNIKDDLLDWNGDHIHTNFKDLYSHLRKNDFYIEILNEDLTKFNAENYGQLLLMDTEEEFTQKEREKLEIDIHQKGLSLIVIADWYNEDILHKIKFFDDNTHKLWFPLTGGSNLPSLNGLLDPFGISFGNKVYEGIIQIKNEKTTYSSGTSIIRFPAGSMLVFFDLNEQTLLNGNRMIQSIPVLGFSKYGQGRIAIYGDSSCFDSHKNTNGCFWLMDKIIEYTSKGIIKEEFKESKYQILKKEYVSYDSNLPIRLKESELPIHSKVVNVLNAKNIPIDNSTFSIRFQIDGSKIKIPTMKILIPVFIMFSILVYLVYIFTKNTVIRERRYSI